MPDDCGYAEARYINRLMRRKVNTNEFSERADAFLSCIPKKEHWLPMKYTRVCPYCRTDPKKDTCVNCGAPQEPGEILNFRNVDVDLSEWWA